METTDAADSERERSWQRERPARLSIKECNVMKRNKMIMTMRSVQPDVELSSRWRSYVNIFMVLLLIIVSSLDYILNLNLVYSHKWISKDLSRNKKVSDRLYLTKAWSVTATNPAGGRWGSKCVLPLLASEPVLQGLVLLCLFVYY